MISLRTAARTSVRSCLQSRRVPASASSSLGGLRLQSNEAETAKASSSSPKLQIKEKLCVYESSVDLCGIAEATFKKCQMAAGMGTFGYLGVLVSASGTASMPALALLGCGAVANTYIILEVPKRAMRSVALKHVERITLFPAEGDQAAQEAGEESADSQASAVERLAATPSLTMEVQSPNLIRRLRLEEPPSAWQGARYSGLAADNRPSFADACKQLLHVDVEKGSTSEPELLDALINSGKVIAEETVEIRSDAGSQFAFPSGGSLPSGAHLAQAQSGTSEDERLQPPEWAKSTPEDAIESLGRRSFLMGAALMGIGMLGFGKYSAKIQGVSGAQQTALDGAMEASSKRPPVEPWTADK
eukprot:TRINITY_DN49657_c0_g1_i1.p1 TRINITY_DN49657_c0_g1~~TRINITY_DN49657_c0_g1_i1.p1  ORF type:complete len:360 (+),score=80.36 TRINITY_DN49657_c0_g1_i1:63-1142(+)